MLNFFWYPSRPPKRVCKYLGGLMRGLHISLPCILGFQSDLDPSIVGSCHRGQASCLLDTGLPLQDSVWSPVITLTSQAGVKNRENAHEAAGRVAGT